MAVDYNVSKIRIYIGREEFARNMDAAANSNETKERKNILI